MPVENDETPCMCGASKPRGNHYCSYLCYLRKNEPDKVEKWKEVCKSKYASYPINQQK